MNSSPLAPVARFRSCVCGRCRTHPTLEAADAAVRDAAPFGTLVIMRSSPFTAFDGVRMVRREYFQFTGVNTEAPVGTVLLPEEGGAL